MPNFEEEPLYLNELPETVSEEEETPMGRHLEEEATPSEEKSKDITEDKSKDTTEEKPKEKPKHRKRRRSRKGRNSNRKEKLTQVEKAAKKAAWIKRKADREAALTPEQRAAYAEKKAA